MECEYCKTELIYDKGRKGYYCPNEMCLWDSIIKK